MPVVTPSRRLDRDGERRLERRLVLGRHEVEAELVAAVGRQREADEPAAVLGHEVDRLRRRELGGHREVALVLAVLVVADDDHPPGADVLDRVLDGRERARAHSHQLLDVLGQHVDLQVDGGARLAPSRAWCARASRGSARPRTRRRRSPRRSARRRRWRSSPSRPRSAAAPAPAAISTTRAKPSSRTSRTVPSPSTWPCTTWPPRRSVARSGSSRLTAAPSRDLAERRAPQRLVHHVGAEAPVRDGGRGQAHAVDRDRVALGELAGERAAHPQAHAVGGGVAPPPTVPRSATSPVNTG